MSEGNSRLISNSVFGQGTQRFYPGMIFHRKTAADIEDPDLPVGRRLCLTDDIGCHLQRLHVILKIGALAAHVKAKPSTIRSIANASGIRSTAPPGRPRTSRRARPSNPCSAPGSAIRGPHGGMLPDLVQLLAIVERDQWFILGQGTEGLDRFYGIGVDDLIPYKVLPFSVGHIPDILIDDHEFREGCDVKVHPIWKRVFTISGVELALTAKYAWTLGMYCLNSR